MYSPESPAFSCYNCPLMYGGQYFEQYDMEAPDAEVNEQDEKREENVDDMYRVAPSFGPGPYPRPRPRPRPPYYPFPPYYPRPYYPRPPYFGYPFFPLFPPFFPYYYR